MLPITHPGALDDQLHAAQRDADRLFHRLTSGAGMDVRVTDASQWLTGRILDLIEDVADGRATRCPHLKQGPRPALAVLWHPDRVVCRSCTGQLTHDDDSPACDRCGATPEYITLHQVQLDTLLVAYALCDGCERLEDAATGPGGGVRGGCESE